MSGSFICYFGMGKIVERKRKACWHRSVGLSILQATVTVLAGTWYLGDFWLDVVSGNPDSIRDFVLCGLASFYIIVIRLRRICYLEKVNILTIERWISRTAECNLRERW